MASLNRISLIGNVGRDPEVKDHQNNKVASFSLAVNEKIVRNDGQADEKVLWFRVTFWGNTADIVEKFVKKGSQVYVDGKLSTSEFLDKDGRSRTSLEVRGQTLTLLGSGGLGGAYPANQQDNVQYKTQADGFSKVEDAPMEQPPIDNESDLPF